MHENDPSDHLELVEERLDVVKRQVERGRVVVRTRVEEWDEVAEIELQHEEVTIERVPCAVPIEVVPAVREEGGVLVIPVVEEQLVVTTRLILMEEIRITKQSHIELVREPVRLRSERVDIERLEAAPPVPLSARKGAPSMTDRTLTAMYDTRGAAETARDQLIGVGGGAGGHLDPRHRRRYGRVNGRRNREPFLAKQQQIRCRMDVFREDVTALLPHLRGFARALTGGDHQLADDIVQDTIVNALRAQHQFTPGTNLKAWLFTILRNRFRSVIVRKHVTSEVADKDLEQNYWAAPEQDSWIEIDAFRRAFKTLSRTHREVLVLAVVHGFSYERIAEICRCEIGTVKSRVNRARANLKRMLLDEDAPRAGKPEDKRIAGPRRNQGISGTAICSTAAHR